MMAHKTRRMFLTFIKNDLMVKKLVAKKEENLI
jgi:hypothetical protein